MIIGSTRIIKTTENTITVEREGLGASGTMELKMTDQDFLRRMNDYENGAKIQDAFDNLNPEEREFIMSGFTPEAWTKMFGSGEENEEEE